MIKVKDILESKKRAGQPLTITDEDTVKEALEVMTRNDTGSVMVVDGAGKLVGMITFREVLVRLHEDPAGCVATPAAKVMLENPDVATPDDSIDQIRSLMTSKHIRYLPVMTGGSLSDVLSFYDVARAVAKESDFENRMLKQYINDWPDDHSS